MKINNISSHPSIFYAADLQAICSPLQALGITYFSHAKVDKAGHFSALCTNPEFGQIYLEKKYYNFDIHMSQFHQPEQYILWDLLAIKDKTLEMDNEFKDMRFGHTFTIYNESVTHTDYYHFAGKLGNATINHTYLEKLNILKRFIQYFHDQVSQHPQLLRSYDITYSLENENSGFLIEDVNTPFNKEVINPIQVNRFYLDNDVYITKREIECLHLLAQGKTFEETAAILNISARNAISEN